MSGFVINPYRHTAAPTGSGTTWNPSDKTAGWTLSNGNYRATTSTSAQSLRCTRGSASGEKLYAELPLIDVISIGGSVDNLYLGLCLGSQSINAISSPYWLLENQGSVFSAGGSGSGGSGALADGGYLMLAYDHDNKKVWVGVNGTWRNSGDPAAGTGQVYTFTSVASFKIVLQTDGNDSQSKTIDFNDGGIYQGTMPSGFTKW